MDSKVLSLLLISEIRNSNFVNSGLIDEKNKQGVTMRYFSYDFEAY
jgi:hypothetical protein